MNWKAFFQGLATAAIGGAATAAAGALTDPQHLNFGHLGPIAGAGAIISVAALFKQSPTAPPSDGTTPPAISNFPSSR